MSVGFPKARAEIDDRSGTLAVTIRNTFDAIDQFKMFLDSTPDADLTSAPYNYTAQEVAVLKSAYNDLAKLGQIYRGEIDLPDAYDFRTFAHLLTGVL
jgi:hypothetical protein